MIAKKIFLALTVSAVLCSAGCSWFANKKEEGKTASKTTEVKKDSKADMEAAD